MNNFPCSDEKCNGTVIIHKKINLHDWYPSMLCPVMPIVAPCDKCGRLHWLNGEIARDANTKDIIYMVDGKPIPRPAV
jgi:hypothetical protein